MKPGERRLISLRSKTLAPNYEKGADCTAAAVLVSPQLKSSGEHGMESTSSGPAWPTR
jgi:hypothetical protein